MLPHRLKAGFGAVVAALLGAHACGGSTTGGSSGSVDSRDGQPCAVDGQQITAKDGCNICRCGGGKWSCTEIDCSATCENGDTKNDACNWCYCANGTWTCTGAACAPECPAPVQTSEVCPPVVVYARDPATGQCCEYGDACRVPPQMIVYSSLALCEGTTPCVPGEVTRLWGGCSVCDSSGSPRLMRLEECPDAGRNTVECGGPLGNTCPDTEFCAYEPGQMCGATGATSFCSPRSIGCPEVIGDPVCGCDGVSYGDACSAAISGTGIHHLGLCGTRDL